MSRCTVRYTSRGRLRAVFLCVSFFLAASLAAGCASGQGSPWVSTFASALPGLGDDVSKQAAAIPYASVDLSVGGQGGLLILAEQTDALTFWQSSSRETIVFRNGYLNSTRGLRANLLASRMTTNTGAAIQPWQSAATTPLTYRVERSWEDAKGRRHAGRANASFVCAETTESVELPLTTLDLERCTESLDWESGRQTRSVVWRHPQTHRIWVSDAVAWPGGPQVSWQVARPWW